VRGSWLFVIGAICGVAAAMVFPLAAAHLHAALHGWHGAPSEPGGARVHTEEQFAFTANAPMDRVAPLFGAEKERVWAADWNPQFVYPLPATDKEGMVFTVAHGSHLRAAWVNTMFDLQNGRIQYVYVIPDAMVTIIHLKLAPAGQQTKVEVEYDRTALSAEADVHVRHMAEGDRRSGPEWEKQVNGWLGMGGK
jgi:hypothetical protein